MQDLEHLNQVMQVTHLLLAHLKAILEELEVILHLIMLLAVVVEQGLLEAMFQVLLLVEDQEELEYKQILMEHYIILPVVAEVNLGLNLELQEVMAV